LGSQEQICKEFARREGIAVLKVYIEEGASAKSADRQQLQAALKYCSARPGRVDFFIVHKLDRFARNHEDHVFMKLAFRRVGTELVSATETIGQNASGKLLEVVLSGIAEFDNNQRTERTKQGMLERVRQGIWVWPAPLGYRRPHRGANIVPDERIAPLIRAAFEQYATGAYTYKAVAETAGRNGLRTKYGNVPRLQEVEKLLHNPLYAGVIAVWGQRFPGSFTPIVSQELFERCQPGAELRAHAAPRHLENPLFPLRRLVVCSRCGEYLTGSCSTGRKGIRYPYYHHRAQRCPASVSHPKQHLETQFVQLLESIQPDPKAKALFRDVVLDYYREQEGSKGLRRAAVEREITMLRSQRARVFQLHREGVYSNDDFHEQKSAIEAGIQQKSRLLADRSVDQFDMDQALDSALRYMTELPSTWMRLEPTHSERLRFQSEIFATHIPHDGERFGTAQLTCLYWLPSQFGGEKSRLVALVRERWNQVLTELRQRSIGRQE
jgi:DNA invertase Pin-like site-specific DNA recombinase